MSILENTFLTRYLKRFGAARRIILSWLLLLLITTHGQAHYFHHNGINDSGKIQYRDDVKVWKLLTSKNRCLSGTSLQVRARLLSGYEDEQSENFQSGGFYLLHKNMTEILRELKLEPQTEDDDEIKPAIKNPQTAPPGAYLEAAARILLTVGDHSQKSNDFSPEFGILGGMMYPAYIPEKTADEENQLLALLIYSKLAETKSVKIETDNFGWRQNTAVCTGDYFLFGYGLFDDQILVWEIPIKILPGRNMVELDQYNTETIFEY